MVKIGQFVKYSCNQTENYLDVKPYENRKIGLIGHLTGTQNRKAYSLISKMLPNIKNILYLEIYEFYLQLKSTLKEVNATRLRSSCWAL